MTTQRRTKLCIITVLLYILTTSIHALPGKTQTPFSKSVARQETAVKKLRSQFKTLFNDSMEAAWENDNYFIYRCDDACADHHQYFHGVASGFLMASMMKRRFKIAVASDTSIFSIYEGSDYNWKSMELSVFEKTAKPIIAEVPQKWFQTEVFSLGRDLISMDFKKEFPNEQVYFIGNHDYVRNLRKNPTTLREFPWIVPTLTNDIVRLIHMGLFRIPEEWLNELHDTLADELGDKKLFCYYGSTEKASFDSAVNVAKLIKRYGDDYKVFIKAKDNEKYVLGNDLEGRVISLANLQTRSRIKIDLVPSFEHILALKVGQLCDVLVTRNNEEGVLAAIIRPTSKHLYCIGHQGQLYSCTRDGITGAFRDNLSHLTNIQYLKKKYIIHDTGHVSLTKRQ